MRPAAVLFDNDGLLLDTETVWTRAEIMLFERHGAKFTIHHKRELIGTSGEASAAKLELMLDLRGRGKDLMAELHDLVMAEVERGVKPMPGAVELLRMVRRAGIPVGLASNSHREFVDATLTQAGLIDEFDQTLAGDEVAHPKPAPDIYADVAALLGADPAACVALEDSPTGVAAAKAAGAFTIGVPSLAGVVLDEADLVCPSLADPRVLARLGLQAA